MAKVLVIEDEQPIRDRMVRALGFEGYETEGAADGKQGIARAYEQRPDVIVADLLLPGLSGIEIVSLLRSRPEMWQTPIIVVTAVDERATQRLLMEMGADDYITKPFTMEELLGSIEAQLRKKQLRIGSDEADAEHSPVWEVSGRRFDSRQRLVTRPDGTERRLTVSEARLFAALIENAKEVLSRHRLFELMGRQPSSPFDRSLDVLVSQLRHKVEADPRRPALIQTVRSLGYVLMAEVRRL